MLFKLCDNRIIGQKNSMLVNGLRDQIESHQRLKKWYLMPP